MEKIKDGVFYEDRFTDEPFEGVNGKIVDNIVYQGRSAYQEILVFDSVGYGRVLVLDGKIQLGTFDEFSYHETFAFTALSCHRNPKKVLIVGGGDGGMARDVLKFPSVQSITVCEIDDEIVKISKELFPELAKSFQSPKVTLVIEDAFQYLEGKENEYDVIICDSTDPDNEGLGNSCCLFGSKFYDMVKMALRPNGLFLSQSGNNIWQPVLKKIQRCCTTRFPVVKFGFVSVAIFSLCQNGFHLCSLDKDLDVKEPYWKFDENELEKLGLQFYNLDIHRSSFALPEFLKTYLNENQREYKDITKWINSRSKLSHKKSQIANGDSKAKLISINIEEAK